MIRLIKNFLFPAKQLQNEGWQVARFQSEEVMMRVFNSLDARDFHKIREHGIHGGFQIKWKRVA